MLYSFKFFLTEKACEIKLFFQVYQIIKQKNVKLLTNQIITYVNLNMEH